VGLELRENVLDEGVELVGVYCNLEEIAKRDVHIMFVFPIIE
jgi:hypothetical protein